MVIDTRFPLVCAIALTAVHALTEQRYKDNLAAKKARNIMEVLGVAYDKNTPAKEIVWQIQQDELPNIRLAWVTTLEVLPGGNLVVGNCHAGPGQPLLVELDPKTKRVVWTLDRHADFGNSVSNSLLLDLAGKTLR